MNHQYKKMDYNHIEHGKPNKYAVIVILAVSFITLFLTLGRSSTEDVIGGLVKEIRDERDVSSPMGDKVVKEQELLVELELDDGNKKEVVIVNDFMPVESGDTIFVRGSFFVEEQEERSFDIVDISRKNGILFFTFFFIVLVFITSGWKGFYSLVGLVFSFAVIFSFIVPQILIEANPVFIGVVGSFFILLATLYLSYGFSRKSLSALIGISLSLLFVGVFADTAIKLMDFSGFAGEESMFLSVETDNSLNLVGLLVAGIIIAAVGVLDDVAITQASTVFSLASVDYSLRGLRLFRKSMEVGQDHISAVVNTLVLAYTGAALPLVLLLSLRKVPVEYFISVEIVAEEIARTLIASSGLLLAVPMTAAIAVLFTRTTGNKRYN